MNKKLVKQKNTISKQQQQHSNARPITPGQTNSQVPFTEPGNQTAGTTFDTQKRKDASPSASSPNLKSQAILNQQQQQQQPSNNQQKNRPKSSHFKRNLNQNQNSDAANKYKAQVIAELSKDKEDQNLHPRKYSKVKELESVPPSAAATLVIAYHNVGAQLEHLGEIKKAMNIYKAALVETRQMFPDISENIIKTIEQALEDCKQKYNKRQKLHFARLKQRAIKSTAIMYNDKSHIQSVDLRKLQYRTFSGASLPSASNNIQSKQNLNRSSVAISGNSRPNTSGGNIGIGMFPNSPDSRFTSRTILNQTFSGASLLRDGKRTMMSSSSGFQSNAAGMRKQRMQSNKRMATSQLSWNLSKLNNNFIGSKPVKQYGWNGSMSGTQIRGYFTPNIVNHSLDYGQSSGDFENDSRPQGGFGSDIINFGSKKMNQDLHTSPTNPKISQQLGQNTIAFQQNLEQQQLKQQQIANHNNNLMIQNGKINFKNLHKILLARKYQSIDYTRTNNRSAIPESRNSDISLHLGENDYSIFAHHQQQQLKRQGDQQHYLIQKFEGGKQHEKQNKIGDLMRRTKYLAAMQQYNQKNKKKGSNFRFKGREDFY